LLDSLLQERKKILILLECLEYDLHYQLVSEMQFPVILLAVLTLPTIIIGDYARTDLATSWSHGQDEIQTKSHKPNWMNALTQAWESPERTVDLASLGIDPGVTFDRLLSPAGIANQFALSIAIQLMFIVGFVVTGLGYGFLLAQTPAGPFLDSLMYFDVHLSPQAIFTTLARSGLTMVWELGARVATTAFLFGIFESVSQIIATTTLQTVWSFVTDPSLKEITLWR